AAVPRTILERTSIGLAPRREAFANGFKATYQRDAVGRRISFDYVDASGVSRLTLIQLFDEAGNRAQDWQLGTEASPDAVSMAYTYNGVNWLIRAGRSSPPAPTL